MAHGHGKHGAGGHDHTGQPHGDRDRFGNPEDLREYMQKLESPDRDAWQQPDAVVQALSISPGATVAEVGAGIGYFTLRLSRAVGPTGHVFAAEVEPSILRVLHERIEQQGIRNVSPIWALGEDPLLPPGACDWILMVGTYHHFADGPAMLRRLARSLKPGGRIANVDFQARELPVGPPVDHKVPREAFLADAVKAGLSVANEWSFLPYHYFIALEPTPPVR